jgi:CheY-like chemotaxis protein
LSFTENSRVVLTQVHSLGKRRQAANMLRVLLVDDEEAILHLLETILGLHKFAVTTASSAQEALGILSVQRFDVVMSDLRMESPFAGLEVARAASRLQPRPLVLLLTGSDPQAANWESTGTDALLQKGTGTIEIPQKIAALLNMRDNSQRFVA